MAKIRVNGEMFGYDPDHKPMAEMLALEKETGLAYGEWEAGLAKGSARALAALAWLVWKRDGRDVPFADIESGKAELNLGTLAVEADEPPGPTTGPAATGPSPSTGPGTSARSRKS